MTEISVSTQVEKPELRRALGPWHLVALGVGGIIGAGIFVITGTAAANAAGPAIVLSFVLAGIACGLAGLCYAEFASMIPVAGSAYTYAHATLGRFVGWMIGWDLILEYLAASGAVSVGWSAYFASLMAKLNLPLPAALSNAPIAWSPTGEFVLTGAIINLPAVIIVIFLSALLIVGIRTTSGFNNAMVVVKVAIVLAVILFGLPLIKMENLTPFIPANTGTFGHYGYSGILLGASMIFFAYIGFDAVSVAAQESRNPQRDMPIGILGSLAICTVLYILMSLTMTGLADYRTLGVPNPVSVAIAGGGEALAWLALPVDIAAVVGLSTVVLLLLYGQSRIFYAMSRDGLLPPAFSRVHSQFRTPYLGTAITGVIAALIGGVFQIDILFELVNIGTLAAFVLVCVGIIVLRRTRPHARRAFRTPLVPFVPIAGALACFAMMATLPWHTQYRLVIWLIIGLVIYVFYGMRRDVKPEWSLPEDEVGAVLKTE